jgi:hypothetical protein
MAAAAPDPAVSPPSRPRAARAVRIGVFLVALAFAAWAVSQADLPTAFDYVANRTSASQRWLLLLAVLLPSGLGTALHTSALAAAFGREGSGVAWGRLWGIRLAGEAINQVTPFLSLGGEPVKAALYGSLGGSVLRGASAVAAARMVMTFAQCLLVTAAVLLTATWLPASTKAMWAFWAFPGLVGVAILIFSGIRFWFPPAWRAWLLERPLLAPHKEGFRASSRVLHFWQEHPAQCLATFCFSLLAWIVPAGEFWLVAQAVGHPISWPQAIALEGLMTSIAMATFFIPGHVGSQEAGLLYVSKLYALAGPVGPLMVVIRRAREILWIGIGMVCLAVLGAVSIRPAPDAPPAAESA